MVGEVFAGIGALKSAFDLARGLKEIDDKTKLNAAIIDLQQTILDAQAVQQELLTKSAQLQARVDELESWDEERKKYSLYTVTQSVQVYAPPIEGDAQRPTTMLCPSCFNFKSKSLLVQAIWVPGRSVVLVCHDCGWHAYIAGMAHPEHKSLIPKPYRGS
jgi:hypothetical protein